MAEQLLSGRYRVVRHLARGGMAEVYLAHDQLLDRPVAVKVLFPELAEDDAFVERFHREARAAAGLNHPNIVSIYDFGQDDGSYFIVMEYVEGDTLRAIIRSEGPLPPATAARIGADVAAALAAAHATGVIHRDVKPGNVLISSGADAGVVKVADFGIARAGDPREALTRTGTVMGTATYLSPEQAQGGELDPRSDVYSLGVVIYEMLTGRPPFTGANPVTIAYQHLSEEPVPPSSHNAAVPPALDAIVLTALAKDRGGRQGSAEELRLALLAVAAGEPDATTVVPAAQAGPAATAVLASAAAPPGGFVDEPPGTPPRGTPSSVYRRRRMLVLGLVAALVVGVVLILIGLLGGGGTSAASMPNTVGKGVEEARALLTSDGYKVVVVQSLDPGAPGRVVRQDPAAGTKAPKGTTVTLFTPIPETSTTVAPSTSTRPATTAVPTTARQTTTTPRPTAGTAPVTTVRRTTVPTTVAATTTPP